MRIFFKIRAKVSPLVFALVAGSSFAESDPDQARETLTTRPGWQVDWFATELTAPIANPVAMDFDSQGRMWVLCMPHYPMPRPGAAPADHLVILEDTNGDGKADRHTVFADDLATPTGFALTPDGVYVAEQPGLSFLRDTNGDGKADHRQMVMSGFGVEDSHHSISAFDWSPDGALIFFEGIFHHSQVETPQGVTRALYAAAFRFQPRDGSLETMAAFPFLNPWGQVYDEWGRHLIADASGGMNYHGDMLAGRTVFPEQHRGRASFTKRKVRPTSGMELLYSRHFPEDVQGLLMINNVIGMQGTVAHRIVNEGSSFVGEPEPPILQSTDPNFRPVACRIGPDGALYVIDWHNPLIGHMQHSLRDPERDQSHGRVWRITVPGRPLLNPPDLSKLSIRGLMDELQSPELGHRARVRRELRGRPAPDALAEVAAIAADPDAALSMVREALWVAQGHGHTDLRLVERLFASPEPLARAAAIRALRNGRTQHGSRISWWRGAMEDPAPEVRLEGLVALSYEDSADALTLALSALEQPMDEPLQYVLRETFDTLQQHAADALRMPGGPEANQKQRDYILENLHPTHIPGLPLAPEEIASLMQNRGVEAAPAQPQLSAGHSLFLQHCAVCHQPDAQGLPGAFPPLVGTPRVNGDPASLILTVIHGISGELEVLGKPYNSAMPPMGALLSDQEIAELLTFLRGNLGNQAGVVDAETVTSLRKTHESRATMWTDRELQKAAPPNP